jgi:hypothetical protein
VIQMGNAFKRIGINPVDLFAVAADGGADSRCRDWHAQY